MVIVVVPTITLFWYSELLVCIASTISGEFKCKYTVKPNSYSRHDVFVGFGFMIVDPKYINPQFLRIPRSSVGSLPPEFPHFQLETHDSFP